jgi:hypothetical protein
MKMNIVRSVALQPSGAGGKKRQPPGTWPEFKPIQAKKSRCGHPMRHTKKLRNKQPQNADLLFGAKHGILSVKTDIKSLFQFNYEHHHPGRARPILHRYQPA